jgi:predicted nucleic acid-binding protein
MAAKVVDVSVLAAAIFNEPEAATALGLLDGAEMYAPRLLAYELANVARTKILRSPSDAEAIRQSLALAFRLDLHWLDPPILDVFQLALTTNLTVYDASYLFLARQLNVPLVSFDKRLAAFV